MKSEIRAVTVFLSSSAGLRVAGWPKGRVFGMWLVVMLVSGASAAAGYHFLSDPSLSGSAAVAQGFAAGALQLPNYTTSYSGFVPTFNYRFVPG